MANFEVPENPEFTEDIRKLETTDPGHANIFNAVFEPIINNVLHVKKMITDHMMAKNPHGIKPADLGLENVENKPMGELSTEFTVAGTRSNIQSGQAMKTILGMLSRWYTDLKTVAWSGKYNDLTDKPTIPNGAAASCAVANNDTTTAAGSVADARIVRQHGLEIDEINRDLGALNDGGAIKGLEVREGDGVYITYADGADTVSKKLGNTKITFDISGSGDNPNYLSSAVFQFHRTSFDGFFAAGYKKCKIVFSSFSGTQSTGRLEIRKNGVTSTYYSNPGTVEFNLAKGDYIAGYVAEQATFRFGASVTMSG